VRTPNCIQLQQQQRHTHHIHHLLAADNDDDETDTSTSKQPATTGDALRAATGIRPSLHPVTINALAEALKLRAQNREDWPLRPRANVEPLQIALSAGRIATEAIQKRQAASDEDGMKLQAKEEQTVAGRVVGVVMRLDDLEATLVTRCEAAPWIAKYGEWATFGLMGNAEVEASLSDVEDRIRDDPLFRLSRAECLLALFLATVEQPSLERSDESVPGGSTVDFLDADRKEVLLGL